MIMERIQLLQARETNIVLSVAQSLPSSFNAVWLHHRICTNTLWLSHRVLWCKPFWYLKDIYEYSNTDKVTFIIREPHHIYYATECTIKMATWFNDIYCRVATLQQESKHFSARKKEESSFLAPGVTKRLREGQSCKTTKQLIRRKKLRWIIYKRPPSEETWQSCCNENSIVSAAFFSLSTMRPSVKGRLE